MDAIGSWSRIYPGYNWITLFLEPQLIHVVNVGLSREERLVAFRRIAASWEARHNLDLNDLYDAWQPRPACSYQLKILSNANLSSYAILGRTLAPEAMEVDEAEPLRPTGAVGLPLIGAADSGRPTATATPKRSRDGPQVDKLAKKPRRADPSSSDNHATLHARPRYVTLSTLEPLRSGIEDAQSFLSRLSRYRRMTKHPREWAQVEANFGWEILSKMAGPTFVKSLVP